MAIKQQRRPAVSTVAPLTNSVQENFRSSHFFILFFRCIN